MRLHRQIAILGFPGVGKSSLAHHFVYQHFYNEYDPNIKTNLQHQCVLLNQEYDLTIIDNAGSDQYTLHHNDFENSDAYILVYAIDDLQSFEMVSKIREKIMSTSTTTRIPLVLVGNKIDRNDERVVSSEEGASLANEWKVQFVETSAMDQKAVGEIFEKCIRAMNHLDTVDNGPVANEHPKSVNANERNPSSRPTKPTDNRSANSKSSFHSDLSTKTNKTCSIS